MMYFYLLSWLALVIQLVALVFSIGAGLFYLAELIEEYATAAKKYLNLIIIVDTVLATGLFLFEDLSAFIVFLCIISNILYFLSITTFPFINVYSPVFLSSIVCFILHNYFAFNFFSANYYQFSHVLTYMTIFCWSIPILLIVSCSANENVLPTYQPVRSSSISDENSDLVTNYFKNKNKKIGLLHLFRYIRDNYLPELGNRKSY